MNPSALDKLLPGAPLCELSHVDVAASCDEAWKMVRHGGMAQSPLSRALFAVRTLPERLAGRKPESLNRLDDLVSTPAKPGFQILIDDPPCEIAVGAIGKVWHLRIPFLHVVDAAEFARFDTPGWIKVAWALRVVPRGASESRIEFEVRVSATDDESWRRFERYFRVIGIGSHWIRRSLLHRWQRALGPASKRSHQSPTVSA
jgi:hypothetical protein